MREFDVVKGKVPPFNEWGVGIVLAIATERVYKDSDEEYYEINYADIYWSKLEDKQITTCVEDWAWEVIGNLKHWETK